MKKIPGNWTKLDKNVPFRIIKNQNLLWFLLISIGVFFIGGAREAVAPLLVIIVLLQNEIKLHKCIFDISIMF